jgi:hypothetical protein
VSYAKPISMDAADLSPAFRSLRWACGNPSQGMNQICPPQKHVRPKCLLSVPNNSELSVSEIKICRCSHRTAPTSPGCYYSISRTLSQTLEMAGSETPITSKTTSKIEESKNLHEDPPQKYENVRIYRLYCG